ncbi:malonic semialdehyde reductase [Lacimicrobium alkaliphilum]|uniref:malonic semialdehyde reductase n=1 Tax=Lacimicrobium alkaliphilum TaxID=1526571 RepID=UPI0009EC2190|nr:malonic semialdehyde reductase [Lacimicrobium alkaliphilum]
MTSVQISAQQQAQIEQAQKRARALKKQVAPLDDDALDLIIREARSHNGWQDKPVTDDVLRQLYDIVKMGSTSMNSCPGRFVFIKSDEARARLKPCLAPLNVNKVLSAPVTVIIAYDQAFYRQMPKLFAHNPNAAAMFENNAELAATSAFRNGTLQGAYLMIAARALGLDVGPMSGFNNKICDETFFAGTSIRSNFLCSLGYGDTDKLFQRLPRLDFDEACELI